MTTDNFCFSLQNRLIQTGQTGGQWYSDTSPFSIPCFYPRLIFAGNENTLQLIMITITAVNFFIIQASGPNVIKLFSSVINGFLL
jgi:hypothetical protein